jgi:death-on-curing protein
MIIAGLIYISLEEVKEFHRLQIETYGGTLGTRDEAGLASAVEMPAATFGGVDLYEDVFTKAVVYAFHIAEAQAFLDGNKRVAVHTAVVFLELNGYSISDNNMGLYEAMIKIANKEMDKEDLAEFFRELVIDGQKKEK